MNADVPEFSDLDAAAKHQLNSANLREYFSYRDELIKDGEPSDFIRQILSGFIWDCLEMQEPPEE